MNGRNHFIPVLHKENDVIKGNANRHDNNYNNNNDSHYNNKDNSNDINNNNYSISSYKIFLK